MVFDSIIKDLKKLDWILIICALLLVGVGLLSIYSSSMGKDGLFNLKKQVIFLVIGFSVMLGMSFVDWRIFLDSHLILFLYFICIIALAGLFFWAPEIKGVRSWYRIGPVSIDPIEPLKLIFIILLAKFFSMRHVEMYRVKHILLSGLYFLLPAVLIFFQPDLGSVIVIGTMWVIVLIVSGIRLRHFLGLCFVAFLILSLSWIFLLHPYQKERLISFVSPHLEPLGAGWSQIQSKIAIGSGGIWGKGIGKGSQTQLGYLTETQTDFIFSAISEEMGLFGAAILLILFSILLWRIVRVGILASSNFPRLFCAGFGALLFSQMFINIGMNLDILPVIGIPLPLVSYGGSSLIMTFAGLGIILSFEKSKKKLS